MGEIASRARSKQRQKHGLLHRDLKPANVMIAENGAKLLDFELANPSSEEASDSHQQGWKTLNRIRALKSSMSIFQSKDEHETQIRFQCRMSMKTAGRHRRS